MRTFAPMLVLTIMITCSFQASAQTESIYSDIVWDTDRTHSGDIVILEGGSLTIESSVVTMSQGSRIVVEEGGSLVIDGSRITTSGPMYDIVGFGYGPGEHESAFLVPASDYSESFTLIVKPVDEGSFFGMEFMTENGQSTYGNETMAELTFEAEASDTWVTVTGIPSASMGISELHINLESGGDENSIRIPSYDLQTRNMRPYGNPSYEVESNGAVEIISSDIDRGRWIMNGETTITGSTIHNAGPILATENSASITINDSSINGSLDDHDVRMGGSTFSDFSDVDWTDGLTDRWERRVGTQQVTFVASDVVYRIDGLGYNQQNSGSQISDQNGIGTIGMGAERVVEIGWAVDSEEFSEAPVWFEEAVLITESFRTAWNADLNMNDYGGSLEIDWNVSNIDASRDSPSVIEWLAPSISMTSIQGSVLNSADLNEGWGANVTISNDGNADAVVYFVCDDADTGERQSVGDIYVGGLVESQSESTFPISWTPADEGDRALICTIMTPSQLVFEETWGGGSVTTPYISFESSEQEEAGSIIPVLIALGIGFIGVVWLVLRRF